MKNSFNYILLLLFCSLLSPLFSDSALAKEYSDLNEESPYFVAIQEFSDAGILEGYSDGTFKPNQPINRAEALKVILKAFKVDTSSLNGNENFKDVSSQDWFYPFVIKAVEQKIVQGFQDGTFKPANQVLFSESLKMSLVAQGFNQDEFTYTDFHPSVKSEDWFSKYFAYGFEKNFVSLETNGGLNPTRALNRGEFVDLVYRISSTEKDQALDISYNWKEETNPQGLSIEYPFEWEYFNLGEGIFLGFFAGQKPNFIKNVQNGARISINFWENSDKLSAEEYFVQITENSRRVNPGEEIEVANSESTLGKSLKVLNRQSGVYDYYIYLQNQTILVAQGSYDQTSLKSLDLIKEIESIFANIQFDGRLTLTAEQKLEITLLNTSVRNKGLETINLFQDKRIIHTDSIGTGSGPVDYYFVPGINRTIKHERSFDVILQVLEGETYAF
jgi:hypothetical protein